MSQALATILEHRLQILQYTVIIIQIPVRCALPLPMMSCTDGILFSSLVFFLQNCLLIIAMALRQSKVIQLIKSTQKTILAIYLFVTFFFSFFIQVVDRANSLRDN